MAIGFDNALGLGTAYSQGTATTFSYPFTINLWFYPTISAVGTLQIFTLHNTINNNRFIFQANTSTSRFVFAANVGTNANSSTSVNYNLNAWNMATAVGTSSTSRTAYINNGGSATNTSPRVIDTPVRWLIGASFTTIEILPTFEGRVAEIGMWNAVLTAAEITSLYKGQKPTGIRPANLKLYLPLIRDVQDYGPLTTSITNVDLIVENHVRRYG